MSTQPFQQGAQQAHVAHEALANAMAAAAEKLNDPTLADVRKLLLDGALRIQALTRGVTASSAAKPACLVVLSTGGTMDSYEEKGLPAAVELIDCQNGEAGDIFTLTKEFAPLLLQAFGPQDGWPDYIRVESDDDVDVMVTLADESGETNRIAGTYSESRRELVLGGMHRDTGYNPSFKYLQSVNFDDQRSALHAAENEALSIWSLAPDGKYRDAVNRFQLAKPLDQYLTGDAPAQHHRQSL